MDPRRQAYLIVELLEALESARMSRLERDGE